MGEKVSAFWPVKAGRDQYLFLLVYETWYSTEIQDKLARNVEQFGADLGIQGKVVEAYRHASKATYVEFLDKVWPKEIRRRIQEEQDPFMLVVRKDVSEFDPRADEWKILWFSDFRDDPEAIPRCFGTISRKVTAGEDVLSYVASFSARVAAQVEGSSPEPEIDDRGEAPIPALVKGPGGNVPTHDPKLIAALIDEEYGSPNPPRSVNSAAERIREKFRQENKPVPSNSYVRSLISQRLKL